MSPIDNATRNQNDLDLRAKAYVHLAEAIKHLSQARVALVASAWHGSRQVQDHSIMVQRDLNELAASIVSLRKIVAKDHPLPTGTQVKTSRNGALAS